MFESIIEKLNKISTNQIKISLGFDGYVDEIITAVAARDTLEQFKKIPTITGFGQRILQAAGKSTNIELVTQKLKLGGNGPIMGNSLAFLGTNVQYIGALGYPKVHQVFEKLHSNFKYISIEDPGHTMAIEFDDGKIMFGRLAMTQLNWKRLSGNVSEDQMKNFFCDCDLLGMINWTQTPYIKEIWEELLNSFLPNHIDKQSRPLLFVDVADPEKRSLEDVLEMLNQLSRFETFYQVTLGLNEKESHEIAKALEFKIPDSSPESLKKLAIQIREALKISCCVIHPVKFAVCATERGSFQQEGPYISEPLISTGAGDHFNAGFSLGRVLGLSESESLVLGVSNSGYYVRTAKSASFTELKMFVDDWQNQRI